MNIRKLSRDLLMSDFISYPLWVWEDDDEYVIPVIDQENLFNMNDAIFAKCEIEMKDRLKIEGVVSIRTSNLEPYVISFPKNNGSLLDIPLQAILLEYKNQQLTELCNQLDKPLDLIFPLKFKTAIKLINGDLLSGSISL